jgi:hypothetical protein
MTKEIRLGKIERAEFGFIDQGQIFLGFSVKLAFDGESSTHAWRLRNPNREEIDSDSFREVRNSHIVDLIRHIAKVLEDAKVDSISELVGKPVEVTIRMNIVDDWRILAEVL